MADGYWTEFAYAPGFDADEVDFTLYEDVFTLPVLTSPGRVPRGSEVSKAWSGEELIDGWQTLVLEQLGDPHGTTKFADLTAYVDAVFSGWDGEENAEITIRAKQIDGTYEYFNVLAHLPLLGTDYTHNIWDSSLIDDLKLRHTIMSVATVEPAP